MTWNFKPIRPHSLPRRTMHARAFSLAFGITVLLATPVLGQDDAAPSAEKVSLARRMLLVERGGTFSQSVENRLTLRQALPPFSEAKEIYIAAVGRVISAHAADLAEVDENDIAFNARNDTEEEMLGHITFHESAEGKSIDAKSRIFQAGVPDGNNRMGLPRLTREEDAATVKYGDFIRSTKHPVDLKAQTALIVARSWLAQKIDTEVALSFCNESAKCTPAQVAMLAAAVEKQKSQ